MNHRKYLGRRRTPVWIYFVFVLTIAAFLLRGIGMDRDRPSFGIGLYDSVDEGIYAEMALDVYNNGGLSREDFPLEDCGYTEPLMQTIVLNNILVYGLMCLLGDNYYALRLPMLVQGLVILAIILWYCVRRAKEEEAGPWPKVGLVLTAVLMLTDFHFLMASVTFESSITRALALVMIWLILRREQGAMFWKFFWVALISVISIFFVYLTNVFLVIPGVALILYVFIKRGKQDGRKAFWGYCAGGIVGMIPAELYYILVWKSGAVMKAIQVVSGFTNSGDTNYNGNYAISVFGNFFESAIKNLEHLFGNQNFFFNPLLSALFLFALGYLAVRIVKKYRPEQCFILFCAVGFTAQTMLSADFAERKAITLYPVMMVALFELICDIPAVVRWVKSHRFCFFCATALCGIFSAYCYWCGYDLRKNQSMYYLPYVEDGGYLWWFVTRMGLVVMLLLTLAGLTALAFVLFTGQRKSRGRGQQHLLVTLMALALFVGVGVNSYMGLRFYYTTDAYADKTSCQAVKEIVGDNYMAGAYGLIFSFYNDAKVVCGDIKTTSTLMDFDEVQFYFDYAHVDYQGYMDIYAPHEIYTWKLIKELPRGLTSSFGLESCSEGIYAKVTKE